VQDKYKIIEPMLYGKTYAEVSAKNPESVNQAFKSFLISIITNDDLKERILIKN
jgi:hypothetical protein